ncbi:hypothetical protein CHRYSEO8AT_490057 [Chryseobacterium sp. 8AT]|nr:hypothetical protein CHRYSEO8AT_490057 [Chryseobacterium sp. 8AT]
MFAQSITQNYILEPVLGEKCFFHNQDYLSLKPNNTNSKYA